MLCYVHFALLQAMMYLPVIAFIYVISQYDKLKILANNLKTILLSLMYKTLFNCLGNQGSVGNN